MTGVTAEVTFKQGLLVIEKGEGILKAPHILIAVHFLGLLLFFFFFLLGLLNVVAYLWI